MEWMGRGETAYKRNFVDVRESQVFEKGWMGEVIDLDRGGHSLTPPSGPPPVHHRQHPVLLAPAVWAS